MTFTSLELGHGNVSIAAFKADNGKHGIMVMHDSDVEIGSITGEGGRTEDEKRHVMLQITSACPESLEVMIGHLKSAAAFFYDDESEEYDSEIEDLQGVMEEE